MTDDRPYKVIPLRASGVTPEAVAAQVEDAMNDGFLDGWRLDRVEPIIYNSSTTGYLLLIFNRAALRPALTTSTLESEAPRC